MAKYWIVLITSLLLYAACKPSMEVVVRPFDPEKEMPRFCLTERMFFYEISEKDSVTQLWIYTNKRLTIDQLISQPLHIYFSETKKKSTHYHLRYKDLVNSNIKKQKQNSIQLRFFEYSNKDTIDLTAKYSFNVATNYNGSNYDLKIEFPTSIFSEFEEPVMGIVSETPEPFNDKKAETPKPTTSVSRNQHVYQQQMQKPTSTSSNYARKIEDIDIWFKVSF